MLCSLVVPGFFRVTTDTQKTHTTIFPRLFSHTYTHIPLWMVLAHSQRRVEDVLLQGMFAIVGLPQLTALQRDLAVLPRRHGGMGLRRFDEDVATAARLSSAALACAALADGGGKGDPFRGAAELDARAAVERLRWSWPSVKGLADSPDGPRDWPRCIQAEKTLWMAGLQHAGSHADTDARAAAVFPRRMRPGRNPSCGQRPSQTWHAYAATLGPWSHHAAGRYRRMHRSP